MSDDVKWPGLARLANIIGIIMALAAIGMVGRFALLLTSAWGGHPRLVG